MNDYKCLHKISGLQQRKEESRVKKIEDYFRSQKSRRSQKFDCYRHIVDEPESEEDLLTVEQNKNVIKETVKKALQKNKTKLKKKLNNKDKVRPFVVGIVRHKPHSPPFLHQPVKYESFAPKNYVFRGPKNLNKIFTPAKIVAHSPFTLKSLLKEGFSSQKTPTLENKHITMRSRGMKPLRDSPLTSIDNIAKKDNGKNKDTKRQLWPNNDSNIDSEELIFGKLELEKRSRSKNSYTYYDDENKENICPNSQNRNFSPSLNQRRSRNITHLKNEKRRSNEIINSPLQEKIRYTEMSSNYQGVLENRSQNKLSPQLSNIRSSFSTPSKSNNEKFSPYESKINKVSDLGLNNTSGLFMRNGADQVKKALLQVEDIKFTESISDVEDENSCNISATLCQTVLEVKTFYQQGKEPINHLSLDKNHSAQLNLDKENELFDENEKAMIHNDSKHNATSLLQNKSLLHNESIESDQFNISILFTNSEDHLNLYNNSSDTQTKINSVVELNEKKMSTSFTLEEVSSINFTKDCKSISSMGNKSLTENMLEEETSNINKLMSEEFIEEENMNSSKNSSPVEKETSSSVSEDISLKTSLNIQFGSQNENESFVSSVSKSDECTSAINVSKNCEELLQSKNVEISKSDLHETSINCSKNENEINSKINDSLTENIQVQESCNDLIKSITEISLEEIVSNSKNPNINFKIGSNVQFKNQNILSPILEDDACSSIYEETGNHVDMISPKNEKIMSPLESSFSSISEKLLNTTYTKEIEVIDIADSPSEQEKVAKLKQPLQNTVEQITLIDIESPNSKDDIIKKDICTDTSQASIHKLPKIIIDSINSPRKSFIPKKTYADVVNVSDEEDHISYLSRILEKHSIQNFLSPVQNKKRSAMTPIENIMKPLPESVSPARPKILSSPNILMNNVESSPMRVLNLRTRNVSVTPSPKKKTPRKLLNTPCKTPQKQTISKENLVPRCNIESPSEVLTLQNSAINDTPTSNKNITQKLLNTPRRTLRKQQICKENSPKSCNIEPTSMRIMSLRTRNISVSPSPTKKNTRKIQKR